jgi:hypothetical protein
MMTVFPRVAFVAGCLLSVSGCTATGLIGWPNGKYPQATARRPVAQVVCVWQPADGKGLDDLPSRGFAGQVFFFTKDDPTPVQADGDVRVYLFDDQGAADGDASKPIHQFDFTDGAWKQYFRPSQFGATYQLFIPYVRTGTHQAKCSLRVRLTPSDGPVVYSELAEITLPGKVAEKKPMERIVDKLAAATEAPAPQTPPTAGGPQFQSYSIPLPAGRDQHAGTR